MFSLMLSFGFSLSIWDRLEPTMVAGHRGGMFSNSYNTLERFETAIKEDVDILEMDLRTTSDGVVVVFHDEDLDRKTNCKGLVASLPWERVKTCKYKGTNHLVPSFEQILQLVNARAIVNAEFKTLSTIKPSIQITKVFNAYSWVYFQVNSEMDKYLEARRYDTQIALLYKPRNEQELQWLEQSNDPQIIIAQMDKDFVTKERVERIHKLGKFVSVNSWKWDTLEERFQSTCKKIFDLKIDIAVTNNNIDCVEVRDSIKPPSYDSQL
jgi:glycerophosphoryl diester phosphodiesterase